MSRIVEDLHALSLADSGALVYRREPVKPVRVLEEILNHFKPRLEKRRIRIDNRLGRDHGAIIAGDADRLGQLFTNLLENTVRYTDSPGSVSIGQSHSPTHWELWLEDSGPGVPAAALERLFDRFYRVEKSRSRTLGGSGLGLSICKSIVETMGGEIRAVKGASGGLRIEIRFPLLQRMDKPGRKP
jgi:two-component system sensor histidine kinase BaeS